MTDRGSRVGLAGPHSGEGPAVCSRHAGLSFDSFFEACVHLCPDVRAATRAARSHAEQGLELDSLATFKNFNVEHSFSLNHDLEVPADGATGR